MAEGEVPKLKIQILIIYLMIYYIYMINDLRSMINIAVCQHLAPPTKHYRKHLRKVSQNYLNVLRAIWAPWGSFDVVLGSLGRPWEGFGETLGRLWEHLERLSETFDRLWEAWGGFGKTLGGFENALGRLFDRPSDRPTDYIF